MMLTKMLFGAALVGGAGLLSICDLCKPVALATPTVAAPAGTATVIAE